MADFLKGPLYHSLTDPNSQFGQNFEFNDFAGTPVGTVDSSQFWWDAKYLYRVTADIPVTGNTTSWTLVNSAAGVFSLSDAGFPPYLSFGTNASNASTASATLGETGMAGFTAPGTTIANGQAPKLYYMEMIFDPHTIASTSNGFLGFSDGGTSGAFAATNWVGFSLIGGSNVSIQPTVGVGASAGTFNAAAQRLGTALNLSSGTFYIARVLMNWSYWATFSVDVPAAAVPTTPPFFQSEYDPLQVPIKIGTYQRNKLGLSTAIPTAASVAYAPAYAVRNGAAVGSSQNIRIAQITVGRQW